MKALHTLIVEDDDLLEDALPDTTLRPTIVTVVDRCRRRFSPLKPVGH
jgi:hypothetical protein